VKQTEEERSDGGGKQEPPEKEYGDRQAVGGEKNSRSGLTFASQSSAETRNRSQFRRSKIASQKKMSENTIHERNNARRGPDGRSITTLKNEGG